MKDPTDLPGLLESATYAAQQSDRWMFVAMLIIFLLAAAWMTRYFTQQLDKARQEFGALSERFNAYLITANTELTKALAKNTEALEKVEKKL